MDSLIEKVKKLNNSVDELMKLVDTEELTLKSLENLCENWEEITDIPYIYAYNLVVDELETFVNVAVSEYLSLYKKQDFVAAMNMHRNNQWLYQVIGDDNYEIISKVFLKYEEVLNNGEVPSFFSNVYFYQDIIDRFLSAQEDIAKYIVKAEDARLGGRYNEMYKLISESLNKEPCNYELYYMLGYYYLESDKKNVNQAYLCFENALHHCDNFDDKCEIRMALNALTNDISVRKVAIVLVSYNLQFMFEQNIDSIRKTLPEDSYRIIVVDNASTDGVYEWLKEQPDILLLRNEENKGFGIACNQAVELARASGIGEYDIFLLNNDTRLTENALFWLRMGLYESSDVGATGSISNAAGNNQEIQLDFPSVAGYLSFGKNNNVPIRNPYDERVRLNGFAVLVRNEVYRATGGMDPRFSPGYLEDDDLSMQILKLGYRLIVCRNSFIYHAGSQSFSRVEGIKDVFQLNYKKFLNKYNFSINDFAYSNENIVSIITHGVNDIFTVIIYGCGLFADYPLIKERFPNARIYGIEWDKSFGDYSIRSEKIFERASDLIKESVRADYIFVNCKHTDKSVNELSNDKDIRLVLNTNGKIIDV